jgi:hypothetical protein
MQKTQTSNSLAKSNEERGVIELQLRDLSDLVEANASPLRSGALTSDAETYIVRKAKLVPTHQPIHLIINSAKPLDRDVGPIITDHFRAAVRIQSEAMGELFRNGRKALLIGLLTLGLCLFLAWYFTYHVPQRPITRLIQESFVILGWVSMWKPIEVFLYEWLPLARRRSLFQRLSSANVSSASSARP